MSRETQKPPQLARSLARLIDIHYMRLKVPYAVKVKMASFSRLHYCEFYQNQQFDVKLNPPFVYHLFIRLAFNSEEGHVPVYQCARVGVSEILFQFF